jgi:putative N6-adenine-specific DNA methylase
VSLRCLVVCPPGLEAVVGAEVEALGVRIGRTVHGGVAADLSQQQLYALNLRLRTATRILVRLANGFVDGPKALGAVLGTVDWHRYIDAPFVVSAASHGSTLFHTGMIEELTASVIADQLGWPDVPPVPEAMATDATASVPQRVSVRLDHDRATISIDASGERLDRRGYRLHGAKAPMRETLAAALVIVSGWDRRQALIDPFCGSGTVAIEAALLAARRAPGRDRRFAFQDWPSFTRKAWRAAQDEARAAERPIEAAIVANDRDAGAVEATISNAERAGVREAIEVVRGSFSALPQPAEPAAIVTNPPYGLRLGDHDRLRDLYDSFGAWLRASPGSTITLVDADRTLTSRLGVSLADRLKTTNGGVEVAFSHGRIGR